VSSLWQSLKRSGNSVVGAFHAASGTEELRTLENATTIQGLEKLRGRNVMLATRTQLASALALIELDGIARRVVLCTPDLTPEQFASATATAEADAMVLDPESPFTASPLEKFLTHKTPQAAGNWNREADRDSEWILLTSGTTGLPKLVLHSFETLAGALPRQTSAQRPIVWSTFYDIRRYGGLQMYLRAVVSGAPLVLSSAGESTRDFLTRAAAAGVTHISGTPSHWRRVLMSGDARIIAPQYVRLSGEVADQPVLDSLKAAYPSALVAHAFASTEAGVGFEVNDGLAGFPSELIDHQQGLIEMQVHDGTLWIRSGRTAARYLGSGTAALTRADGYVDTGDMVELSAGRYYFRGRKGGIINVGGLKVYPEEVEAVLNADARVRMSLVKARRNPITGAIVAAEVVLTPEQNPDAVAAEALKNELLEACRRKLAAHKVPAILRIVPALELTAAGKLVRPSA
jgi:acyl-coenzyme A synthetase/AMP-(fatty) acid ligase